MFAKQRAEGKSAHGLKAEKKAAKRLGGRQTVGSGNMIGDKGDIDLPNMLIESKSTIHASLGVKHKWLEKISKEALCEDKEPALIVLFVNDEGNPIKDGSWVMIPERVFQETFCNNDDQDVS